MVANYNRVVIPACLTLSSSAMAFSCSFQRITVKDCSFDRLDKSKSLEIVSLRNCSKDISNPCSQWSFTGVTTGSELILPRVVIFARTRRRDSIQSAHAHQTREIGLGWRQTLSSAVLDKTRPSSVGMRDFCSRPIGVRRCRTFSSTAHWKLVSCGLHLLQMLLYFICLSKRGSEIMENGLLNGSKGRKRSMVALNGGFH